jgi:tRNA (cmo5U34)-methyltransferase
MTRSIFDPWASQYDRARRQLIPCFDRFYQAARDQLPFPVQAPIRVLDLGAGTGLLTAFVLERYAQAHITLYDASSEMLAVARRRFHWLGDRVACLHGDYRQELPPGPFHAVVSALSIHHLDEAEKLRLFYELPVVLHPGGVFVNADQVLGETPEQERQFRESWLVQVRAAGITPSDLNAALERMKADRMSPLAVQLDGLRAAGFQDVRCVFQQESFVVYTGRVSGSRTNGSA